MSFGCEYGMDFSRGTTQARPPRGEAGLGCVVTVLQALDSKPINKVVTRNPDGTLRKGMAPNPGEYIAQTVAVPDLASFADVIADLSKSPDKTLMLGSFKDAPDTPFHVVPEPKLRDYLGLAPGDRDGVLGFHQFSNGAPMVARLKDNCAFGGWLLFDRDAVDGMPAELASLDRAGWLEAMDTLLPGFKDCGKLTLPSTSSRIEVDGQRLESSSYHVFVQVSDPHDIPRVWGQLLPKAMVTQDPASGLMLGFMRPKYDSDDRSKVLAYQPWSIFDPSTGQTNRLVFDGAPVVRGPGLRVLPAAFEPQDGPPLDLSLFKDLTSEEIERVRRETKVEVQLERTTNGSGVRVVGVSTTSHTLTLGLELKTKEHGTVTVQQLLDIGAGHTRCQSPFRESSSWAAYYNVHRDGKPFLYDSGTNVKYVLAGETSGDNPYDFSHDGLALHMGKGWAPIARHVALWGRWLFWSGSRWVVDKKLHHMTLTRDYLRRRADELVRDAHAGKFRPEMADRRKAIDIAERIAKDLRSGATIKAVADIVRSNADLAAVTDQWDCDQFLLGGKMTVELRTGDSRTPQPLDYITKHVACEPSFEPPTLWLSCLDTWTAGDKELQDYLQRMCGYMLTGSIKEEVFFFFYGLGKNGKTKFAETIKGILGDYAGTMGSEVLMVSQNERHPCEIARLRGLRLAVASEIEHGKAWAESKIKSLTGGDRLQARFMRQDIFEFDPSFKLLVIGNNKPSLSNVDEAIKRRLHLVPFTVTIPEDKRDHDLAEKLKAEWPQILGWMIEGCLKWQRNGLRPPPAVLDATQEYLAHEDTFEQWRDACTEADVNAFETHDELWRSWQTWAQRTNEAIGSKRRFIQLMEERSYQRDREGGTGRRGFKGLRILRNDPTADRADLQ